jgi:hypothetical protein
MPVLRYRPHYWPRRRFKVDVGIWVQALLRKNVEPYEQAFIKEDDEKGWITPGR